MTRRIRKLFILFLLLGFTAQPLLAQALASQQNATPPCPMQMQQQMDHHGMPQHGDCASHAGKVCINCDLCGHTSNGVVSGLIFLDGLHSGSAPADSFRSAFVSIALPVDSPPPRIL